MRIIDGIVLISVLMMSIISMSSSYAEAKPIKIGGYDFVYEETTCAGNTCTLSIKSFPTVYDMLGRNVDISDAMDVTTDSFAGISVSIGGQYPISLIPEVMICTTPSNCQNISIKTGANSIRSVLGTNWTVKVQTTKMKDSWKFAYNMTSTPSRVKAFILRINGSNPLIGYDFSDLTDAGFVVKQTSTYVYVETPTNTAWMDPTIVLLGGNVSDDTHLSNGVNAIGDDFGADDDLYVSSVAGDYSLPIVRYGLRRDLIPSDATITNATAYMRIDGEAMDAGEGVNISVYEVYQPAAFTVGGGTWTEGTETAGVACSPNSANAAAGTEISWLTRPNVTAQMNQTRLDALVVLDGATAWSYWNVTQAVARAVTSGYNNITLYFNATLYSGAPTSADCLWYSSAEDATATYRPMLNITYTQPAPKWSLNQTNSTLAGSDIKHSVNWTFCVGCVANYTFQFCNGTWNGSNCLPYSLNITYTLLLNSSNSVDNLADIRAIEGGGTPPNSGDQGIQIKWNISKIPIGAVIESANITLFTTLLVGTVDTDLNVSRVDDQTWTEASSLATYNGQALTNITGATFNTTLATKKWVSFNITNIIKTDYAASNSYSTIRFEDPDYHIATAAGVLDDYTQIGFYDLVSNRVMFEDRENSQTTGNYSHIIIKYTILGVPENWVNSSLASFGSGTWSNVTKTVNSTIGANVAWRIYANDSYNVWNVTDVFNYTVTAAASTCTYGGSGNWIVSCSDNCLITSATNVAGNITIGGTGTFKTTASIGYINKVTIWGTSVSDRCKVTCAGGCFKKNW